MDRDQELALLGVLEGQFGERQRALAGLHLEEGASRQLHAEMVDLQHRATQRELAAVQAETETESPTTPRHRRPSRVLQAVDLLTDRHRHPADR
jgi:hypothetical protein